MANKYIKNELLELLETQRDAIIEENHRKMADYEAAFEEWRETAVAKVAQMVNETTIAEPRTRDWSSISPPAKPVYGAYRGLVSTEPYDKAIRQVQAMAGDVVELRNDTDITSLL